MIVQTEQAEAARAEVSARCALDGGLSAALLEQTRLDPKILSELAAVLRDRPPAISFSVVALHGPRTAPPRDDE